MPLSRLVAVFTVVMSGLLVATADRASAGDGIKIEHPLGFHTAAPAEHFRAYWESVKDRSRMAGDVSDYLTAGQIDSIIMLEVGIAVDLSPKGPGLRGELLSFLARGNRFEAGRLPDRFDRERPRKELVALFRTRKGGYGLITRYREFTVVELNGRVGVAPTRVAAAVNPPAP